VSSSWKRGVADERFVLTPTLFCLAPGSGQQRHPQCRPVTAPSPAPSGQAALLLNADDFGDDAADRLDDEREMARILMLLGALRIEEQEVIAVCDWAGLSYTQTHGTRFAGRNGPFSALPRP